MFQSFDRTENIETELLRPERYQDLYSEINTHHQLMISGSKLSYCAAGASPDGATIDYRRFNRILAFEASAATIRVESGITIYDLLAFCVEKGLWVDVLPGYPHITVGGCVAFNVHGKSQFHSGNFVDIVESLTLYHPSHGHLNCSRSENDELFFLTCGGMGLTGLVQDITLRLSKVKGNCTALQRFKTRNLAHSVLLLQEKAKEYDILYSWNNLCLTGKNFGQGWLYAETYENQDCSNDFHAASEQKIHQALIPPNLHFPLASRFINFFYSQKEAISPQEHYSGLLKAAFPINGKEIFYQFFGKQGLHEYQFIVPFENWPDTEKQLRKLIAKHRVAPSLGSLKLFKGERSLLNFCGEGICLAIDVAATAPNRKFLNDLDSLMLENQGIVNLSKDSRIEAGIVKQLFSGYEEFAERLQAFDSKRLFRSALSNRLEL